MILWPMSPPGWDMSSIEVIVTSPPQSRRTLPRLPRVPLEDEGSGDETPRQSQSYLANHSDLSDRPPRTGPLQLLHWASINDREGANKLEISYPKGRRAIFFKSLVTRSTRLVFVISGTAIIEWQPEKLKRAPLRLARLDLDLRASYNALAFWNSLTFSSCDMEV